MYTLLSGFYRYLTQKDEYSILILGLDNAGKTTYLEQAKAKFNKNQPKVNLNKITTTVGLNIGTVSLDGVHLSFWDLGGQEELQSLWDKYYAESHGLIYVIDSSDVNRLEESQSVFNKLIVNEALDGVPLLMLANKQDLETSLPVNDVKAVFHESARLLGHRDCLFKGTSALKGYIVADRDGVDDGIKWIVNRVKHNAMRRPPLQKEIT